MHTNLTHWIFGTLLALAVSFPALADSEVVGHIPKITRKFVEINGQTYPLLRGNSENLRARENEATECWYQYRITCGTLADSGYFDKARVTLRDGIAIRIEVLEHRP